MPCDSWQTFFCNSIIIVLQKYFIWGLYIPIPRTNILSFLRMKKERMLDKKEKTLAAAFFYRKMPDILPRLRGERIFGRVERRGTRKVSGSWELSDTPNNSRQNVPYISILKNSLKSAVYLIFLLIQRNFYLKNK